MPLLIAPMYALSAESLLEGGVHYYGMGYFDYD